MRANGRSHASSRRRRSLKPSHQAALDAMADLYFLHLTFRKMSQHVLVKVRSAVNTLCGAALFLFTDLGRFGEWEHMTIAGVTEMAEKRWGLLDRERSQDRDTVRLGCIMLPTCDAEGFATCVRLPEQRQRPFHETTKIRFHVHQLKML